MAEELTMDATTMDVQPTQRNPSQERVLEVLPGLSAGVARAMTGLEAAFNPSYASFPWQHPTGQGLAVTPLVQGLANRLLTPTSTSWLPQIGQPFDTIKTRVQVLGAGTALAAKLPPSEVYKDSMDCVRKMVRSEGPLSFYKGTVAPLVGNMILLGIHFPTFSAVRNMLEGDDHYSDFSYTNALLAGAAAGAAGSLVSTPVELVRTKMQMQKRRSALVTPAVGAAAASSAPEQAYKGSVDCFRKVLTRYGIKGLYRGFAATAMRDMQGYAWFFLGYEATVNYFLQNAGPGVHTKADLNYLQVMAAGVAAGFGLWGSMFPIDTLKSKLQADPLAKPQYSSTADCLRQVVKSEGQIGLWRGFPAAMYRAIPVNAGVFLAVEGTRQGIQWYEQNTERIYGGVLGNVTYTKKGRYVAPGEQWNYFIQ